MASLSQGRTAAAQCGLFIYKSVPVIFEPPCIPRSTVFSAHLFELCVGARIGFEVFDMHFTANFSVHLTAASVISIHLHNFVSALNPPLQTQTPFKYLFGPSVANNFLKVSSNYDFILHIGKCFLLYSAAVHVVKHSAHKVVFCFW